jgi:hypothetical protein
LSDTPLGIAITIPFGFGAKALDVFEPTPEVLTYSKMKGSGESVYSLTVFCPKCSDTHEYNNRAHEWRPKWLIEERDYSFQVVYSVDSEGITFAQCSKCEFDLRDEYIYGSIDDEITSKNEDIHQVSITGVYYGEGCFVMPLESFKKAIREGFKRKATLYATIGLMSYKIAWEVYSQPDNIISKDGCVFLRKNLWKQA